MEIQYELKGSYEWPSTSCRVKNSSSQNKGLAVFVVEFSGNLPLEHLFVNKQHVLNKKERSVAVNRVTSMQSDKDQWLKGQGKWNSPLSLSLMRRRAISSKKAEGIRAYIEWESLRCPTYFNDLTIFIDVHDLFPHSEKRKKKVFDFQMFVFQVKLQKHICMAENNATLCNMSGEVPSKTECDRQTLQTIRGTMSEILIKT